MSVEQVYRQYEAYVRDLNGSISSISSDDEHERALRPPLRFEEFKDIWCSAPDERWFNRFSAGFQKEVATTSEQILTAITRQKSAAA